MLIGPQEAQYKVPCEVNSGVATQGHAGARAPATGGRAPATRGRATPVQR